MKLFLESITNVVAVGLLSECGFSFFFVFYSVQFLYLSVVFDFVIKTTTILEKNRGSTSG